MTIKKATLLATALICANLIVAGNISAQTQATDAEGTPVEATSVAGFSPSLADPQPVTKATLREDANRLIRWQGWLDVDAFSASILEQMQKQLGNKIPVGKFTIAEPDVFDAVNAKEGTLGFVRNKNLDLGAAGEELNNVKLFVWTYRHNYADQGLHQLYISLVGDIKIGDGISDGTKPGEVIRHRDVQSLGYEFGRDNYKDGGISRTVESIFAKVEIWRGAVVRVNVKGELEVVGNEAGAVVYPDKVVEIQRSPIVDWERAPSLKDNPNYNPLEATGAAYVEPLERVLAIPFNDAQTATGEVTKPDGDRRQDVQEQPRVKTDRAFRLFRNR